MSLKNIITRRRHSLIALKLLLGLNLLAFASRRQAGMTARELFDDSTNAAGRSPIAVSEQEQRHERETRNYLKSVNQEEDGGGGGGAPEAVATERRNRPSMATLLTMDRGGGDGLGGDRGSSSSAVAGGIPPRSSRSRSSLTSSRTGSTRARLPTLSSTTSKSRTAAADADVQRQERGHPQTQHLVDNDDRHPGGQPVLSSSATATAATTSTPASLKDGSGVAAGGGGGGGGGGKKHQWRLEEVERWTMVKRIF